MSTATPQSILTDIFGYPQFRGWQEKIIQHCLANQDALVLMPTGGGKSLCYQIPAILRHQRGLGTTLVVSPLIALMHDQVGALSIAGIKAAFLNSSQDLAESRAIEQGLISGEWVMLYVAPERLLTPRFLNLLHALYQAQKLSFIAIDEAHCVSQWGHDFRPEYHGLSVLADHFPSVPRLALTATADALTRQDIVERLRLTQAQCFLHSFDRANIHYRVVEKNDVKQQLWQFIQREHANDSGIVYCLSRQKVEDTAQWLKQKGLHALPYHAGLPSQMRADHHARFLQEEQVVMVATIAFGMGIDKPNVRFVAHIDLPKNIESYYQETGRAGRDGLPATAWLAYGLQDVMQQRRMIDESPAAESFKHVLRAKLDALLAFAEATDCRRQYLLQYFEEASQACGNCDNCLNPPIMEEATLAAQQLLSCLYRIKQHSHISFGATHVMDVLRGKSTEKVKQFQHQQLTTFGIGSAWSEKQWRRLIRQLIAKGLIRLQMDAFNTLHLTEAARRVLKGEQKIYLRVESKAQKPVKTTAITDALTAAQQATLAALKAWRRELAQHNDLPAYVILHDMTLHALVEQQPQAKEDLRYIPGIGAKKLELYGDRLLQILAEHG